MKTLTKEVSDVPEHEVDRVVGLFEVKPIKVEKILQPNGNYTLIATFRDENKSDLPDGGSRDFP